MNADYFKFLCNQCDQILTEEGSSIDTISVGWLHILSKRQAWLINNTLLSSKWIFCSLMIPVRSAIFTLFKAVKSQKSELGWIGSNTTPLSIDVLLISHLLNKEQLCATNDFYFGALSEKLQERKVKCATLLWNQTGEDNISLMGSCQDSAYRIMMDATLSIPDEIRIRKLLKAESRRLGLLPYIWPAKFNKNICKLAACEAMSTFSIANMRFYIQMISLIMQLRPKKIVVTYEGHAWERLAFAAARYVDKEIECIGYQHTVVFPGQHAIKRSLGAALDPSIIIGSGKGSLKELMDGCNINLSKIIVGGTHRFNIEALNSPRNFSKKIIPSCIVIPEGLIEECLLIFQFALKAAKRNKEIKFIFRMHPVLKYEQLVKIDKSLAALPSNIELSDKNINEDFKRSRWALYRGSSAIIYGVIHGLRPFYLAIPGELTIDPIYKVKGWRLSVTKPEELCKHIERDINISDDELVWESKEAVEYCKDYFSEVDYNVFIDVLVN